MLSNELSIVKALQEIINTGFGDKDSFELFLWLASNCIAESPDVRNFFLNQMNIVNSLSYNIHNLIKE